jgi:hypothetical protein
MNPNPTSTEKEDAETNSVAPKNGAGQSVPFRNPKKSKPTQVLPSDRLAAEKQLEALRAFVVASEAEGGPVTNDQVGKIIAMSGQTVVVTNAFFTDIGLLIRSDSGRFTPGQAAKEYQAAYDWDANRAGAKLAPAFRDTWFAKALTPRLKMRALTKSEALAFLAEACKASPEYQLRLSMLLEFLNTAGIISLAGDEVKAASGGPAGAPTGGDTDEVPNAPKPPPELKVQTIPQDAPFIYIDPEKTKKVILVTPTSSVTQKEFDRIKSWFELQFFITGGDDRAKEISASTTGKEA